MTEPNRASPPGTASERDIVRRAPPTPGPRHPSDGLRGDAYAVVIGVNQYADPVIPRLRFARADAEGFAEVLTDPRAGQFDPDRVKLLVDEQATERAIRSTIETVSRRAGPDDTVVIYFAGHGAPVISPATRAADGIEKYLLPYDAQADQLRSTGISMSDVRRFFSWLESRRVVCFLDCCYSGAATTGDDSSGRAFVQPNVQMRAQLTDEFLDDLAGEGRVIVTACGVNEVSLERAEIRHGLFTHRLIEGLRGAADSDLQTGRVSLDQLYRYVRAEVMRDAREINGRMQPRREGSVDGELYLSRYETEGQRRARSLVIAAVTATERGAIDDAERLWREVLVFDAANADAVHHLAEISEQRAARQRMIEEKQGVLLEHRAAGALSGVEFADAMELLEKDAHALDERERRILQLIDDLVEGSLRPAQYLHALRLISGTAAVTSARQVPKQRALGGPVTTGVAEPHPALAEDSGEQVARGNPTGAPSVPPSSDSRRRARRRMLQIVAGFVALAVIAVLATKPLWRGGGGETGVGRAPAVVSDGKTVYLFVTDDLGKVYFNAALTGQSFRGWHRLTDNVAATSALSAGAVDSYLYMVMTGQDGKVYLNQGSAEVFNTWAAMNFTSDAAPAVVGVENNVYFFAKTPNGYVYYNWAVSKQAAVGWTSVPGNPGATSSPSAGAVGSQVFVAVRGVNGDVKYNRAPARGSFDASWTSIKFKTDAAPGVVGAGGSIYVFAKSADDGNIYYTSAVPGDVFPEWKAMKSNVRAATAPGAGAIGNDIFVAFIGVDGKLYYNQGPAGSRFGDWFPMELPHS